MAGVFCLGIATLDYVYSVEHLPTRGEKYRARDLALSGGGCAGTASAAIARLGGTSWIATRLGDDVTGDRIVADLAADGVDTRFAHRFTGLRSPVSSILVDAAGERQVVSFTDAATPTAPDWLPAQLPAGTGAVLADIRWAEGTLAALRLAREAGLPSVLDGDRPPPHPDIIPNTSHVALSAQALRELMGDDNPHEALARLAAGKPNWFAVTLGRDGVLFTENGVLAHLPSFEIEPVDTLGAGDVWHGAFALALAEGKTEREAIRFASATAAIKCLHFGGRNGTPRRDEVERFLSERG
ncbi:PfkB family carbohydrate kinase [Bosea sp. BK604]|uniref:PfkB family carbohydrate kinase n=1 Tax=Bosea sp. BK604 TaxID=2512180 RepID=UPI00104AEC4A|nr:PfkB family carbohydrate kinase [Bosea sp. BK604]TCR64888.1 sulfofructose kinase [Bosea sp. BK604]